jgi:hypothetical protein
MFLSLSLNPGHEDPRVEGLHEGLLRPRDHVEAVDDLVSLDVIEELLSLSRVIVAVVEGPGSDEKVDVLPPFLVLQGLTPGLGEDDREVATVASNL